jgi:hypothetical protein
MVQAGSRGLCGLLCRFLYVCACFICIFVSNLGDSDGWSEVFVCVCVSMRMHVYVCMCVCEKEVMA